ncbi:Phage/plasmid primase, P4 family, C-terminal domain [Streptomyces ambofaciens ATCC 23877]|uniref:Phage/plasmid primase, P4 family, C-terminal domain n=1 Tax=Streptomyces ambofaciens (strain ATCC 23877 / 3486 / DSM 40053 / JCM 4204 / NBRC 12836 / NRRL B-2516) TaxID=278992 RepID=A0A0K2B232_STRA7|nr:Phage/plasmid primase, P4 family, C-terminal domain [Streptomyces ambofaciens ATCC 23877]WNA15394.1 DNA primase [Streptomyces phage Samy]
MRLSEILGRLAGVEEDHDGHLAFCPVHADRNNQSLKLTLKEDGKLLLVCRTGCPKGDVLERLRMRESDLFDVINDLGASTISAKAPESVGPGEIAGLRMFVDETSAALEPESEAASYLFDRFGITLETAEDLGVGYAAPGPRPQPWLSRGFTRYPRLTVPLAGFDGVVRGLQGRDLSGKCPARWVSLTNVDGKQWAKYGVMRSGAGYDTVLICEGPGDALTAVGAGYDAVAIRGAGLARNAALVAELADGLRDLDVVIAGDRDRAGAGFTDSLAVALVKAGVMVRRLEIPNDGDDLTDWRERDAEAFPGQLHAAVRAATVVELEETKAEPVKEDADEEADVSATDAALQTMSQSAREAFDLTDVGIAVRLRDYMARSGGGVRYASGLGFLVWDGKVWAPGNDEVRTALLQMGAELIASGDDGARKIALRALTNRAIEDIIKVLPSVPGVPASAADFDSDPELLSVANGTVNLRTKELRPHDPADMITRRLDVAYRPGAKAERWLQFLDEIFPHHPELPAYMRRLIGYGITGSTAEECFVFLHGDGKNGKSKFLGALIDTFKGVTKSTEFSTFESRVGVGQASPEVAALRGARLVTASETEKYSRLAEGLIKQLTGGDPVTCRMLYGAPFTYVPSFLLLVAGNYKPAILSQDYGIWRRVKLVPFEASFRGAKADLNLAARLRAEREGILAWAIDGAAEWYASGLQEPDSIATATQDYRESEDRLAEFLVARCVEEPGTRVAPMAIRRAYQEWAEDAGLSRKEVLSGWALGVELESRDFAKVKRSGRWGFEGLRLKSDEEIQEANAAENTPADEPGEDTDIFNQSKEAA